MLELELEFDTSMSLVIITRHRTLVQYFVCDHLPNVKTISLCRCSDPDGTRRCRDTLDEIPVVIDERDEETNLDELFAAQFARTTRRESTSLRHTPDRDVPDLPLQVLNESRRVDATFQCTYSFSFDEPALGAHSMRRIDRVDRIDR